jgi:hypothetical protein
MKKCPLCGIQFPDHLVQPLHVGDKALVVCPICALEEINELHGLPYGTPFRGTQAKNDYEEAWNFLNK